MSSSPGGTSLPRKLERALGRPTRFAPHDARFWDDPHISEQMLKAHLDETTDAATRRPAIVDRSVEHLCRSLAIQPGDRLLDLGCGPGIYSVRFAQRGIDVGGIDLSQRSIAYGRRAARRAALDIDYRVGDYCRDDLGGPFDAAVMIYLDFGVLDDAARDAVLERLHAALRPGGAFVFDVHGMARPRPPDSAVAVSSQRSGFWRPHPHLAIETTYRYGIDVDVSQTAVVDPDGAITVYRVWDRAYTITELRRVLGRHGFAVENVWGDLEGTPWRRSTPTLGVLARRKPRRR